MLTITPHGRCKQQTQRVETNDDHTTHKCSLTMAKGRQKGAKNKEGHKAGGDRKSEQYKKRKAEKEKEEKKRKDEERAKKKEEWDRRIQRNRAIRNENPNIEHPLSPNNLRKSQAMLIEVLNHPSMPKSRNLPSAMVSQEDDDDEDDDDEYCLQCGTDEDGNDSNTWYRQAYMPPEASPLKIHLDGVQKRITSDVNFKKQRVVMPKTSPMATGLGAKPTPDKFYTNVTSYIVNPEDQHAGIEFQICCPYCKAPSPERKGWRYRPAFKWGEIVWVHYERFCCHSKECKGDPTGDQKSKYFSTIDTLFRSKLPSSTPAEFEFVFPKSGPGISLEMVEFLSQLTDKAVLAGPFTKMVNQLQWNRCHRAWNACSELLNDWLDKWPVLEDCSGKPPLHATGCKGMAMVPCSAFGEAGHHNGIKLSKGMVTDILFEAGTTSLIRDPRTGLTEQRL